MLIPQKFYSKPFTLQAMLHSEFASLLPHGRLSPYYNPNKCTLSSKLEGAFIWIIAWLVAYPKYLFNRPSNAKPSFLAEISFEKSLEGFTMSSFVPCHLMNRIMDCIKVCSFSTLCKIKLASSSTVFSSNTKF